MDQLTSQALPNPWFNPRFNSLMLDSGADLKGSNLVGVGLIDGVPASTLAGAVRSTIIYRPGGALPPPPTNVLVNWSDVVNAVTESAGAVTLYIDDSKVSPAPLGSINGFGRLSIHPYVRDASPSVFASCVDGVVLTDVTSISGPIQIQCTCTTTSTFNSTIYASVMSWSDRANFRLMATSTKHAINIPNNFELVLGVATGATFSSDVLTKAINVGSNATLIYSTFDQFVQPPSNEIKSTDGTSTLVFQYDASIKFYDLDFLAFTGTIMLNGIDLAQGVQYDDSIVSPPLGDTEIQGAIDTIKGFLPLNNFSAYDAIGSTQSVPATTPTALNFWNTIIGSGTLPWNGLTGVLTIPSTNKFYQITANISLPTGPTGTYSLYFQDQSSSLIYGQQTITVTSAADTSGISSSFMLDMRLMSSPVLLSCMLFQDTGAPINVGNTGVVSSFAVIQW